MMLPTLHLRKPSLPMFEPVTTVPDVSVNAEWNGDVDAPLEVEIFYQFNAIDGMFENVFQHSHPSVVDWEIQYIDGYVHKYIHSDNEGSKYVSGRPVRKSGNNDPDDSSFYEPDPDFLRNYKHRSTGDSDCSDSNCSNSECNFDSGLGSSGDDDAALEFPDFGSECSSFVGPSPPSSPFVFPSDSCPPFVLPPMSSSPIVFPARPRKQIVLRVPPRSPVFAPRPSPSSRAELPWFSILAPESTRFDEDHFEKGDTSEICKNIGSDLDHIVLHNTSRQFHHVRMLIKAQIRLQKAGSGRGYIFTVPGLARFYNNKDATGEFCLQFTEREGDSAEAVRNQWYHIGDDYDIFPFTSNSQKCSFNPSEQLSLRILQPQHLPIYDFSPLVEETVSEYDTTASEEGTVIHHLFEKKKEPSEWAIFTVYLTFLATYVLSAITAGSDDLLATPFATTLASSLKNGLHKATTCAKVLYQHPKLILLFWLLLRAFFHEATVKFERNIAREATILPSTAISIFYTPSIPTLHSLPQDTVSAPVPIPIACTAVYDGPITFLDYFDYFLGWKGPNGTWK